jgi:hypothetical protein
MDGSGPSTGFPSRPGGRALWRAAVWILDLPRCPFRPNGGLPHDHLTTLPGSVTCWASREVTLGVAGWPASCLTGHWVARYHSWSTTTLPRDH